MSAKKSLNSPLPPWIDSSVRTSVQVPEPRHLLGRVSTIVVALIVGALGGFLSFKGYVRRA